MLLGLKLAACPHCHRTGALIGHGFLRGYAERGSDVEVRGRRFFCSDRGRRTGCGRTTSTKLRTVLSGYVVRTLTLWCFVQAVLDGFTRRAAWLREACGVPSLSSVYRLWRRLCEAQTSLRTRLCREARPPPSTACEPLAQLFAHAAVMVGSDACGGDLLAALQGGLGQGLFDR